jgi:arylsulfatase A-like enzyme
MKTIRKQNLLAAALIGALVFTTTFALAADAKKPNVVYFLVDNLGEGELSCYSGGPLRGTMTPRIDEFAKEGMRLLNFAPETQCTPSRSALMTGRYSIRSGNQSVALPGAHSGLVKWERTLGDIFSDAGYATSIVGKWHIGDEAGRWPTDHGFDEWYGIPGSYDECLWLDDPWYKAGRDLVPHVLEGRKGEPVHEVGQMNLEVRRNIDVEYMKRAKAFLKRSTDANKPFFLYFCHSMMHFPTVPRDEFKGKTGHGDFADSLLEMDTDFGTLLDYLKELGVDDNTIIVFSGDNGPEELEPWRGSAGPWSGSYFTGMEGSLRTPAMVRYPGHVPAGQVSDEIVHITDMFTTLTEWAGLEIPKDRVIDGLDQRAFLEGSQTNSARDGFLYWMGDTLYGVKWHQFKMVMVLQKTLTDPAQRLSTPQIVNLDTDPQERKPYDYPYVHTWVIAHTGKLLGDFQDSVKREPLIPFDSPLDYVPKKP